MASNMRRTQYFSNKISYTLTRLYFTEKNCMVKFMIENRQNRKTSMRTKITVVTAR